MASTSAFLRPASSSAISRILSAMESSCMGACADRPHNTAPHDTTPALPADLNDFTVFEKNRNGALAGGFAHTSKRGGVGFHVKFEEFAAREFQPLAHFRRIGTG